MCAGQDNKQSITQAVPAPVNRLTRARALHHGNRCCRKRIVLKHPPIKIMSQKPIDIGIGVWRGSYSASALEQAGRELVERARQATQNTTLPVRGALLFATADWCETEVSLPKGIRHALRESLGYEVPLIGGSTALMYTSTETEAPFIQQGLTLILFCSNDIWLTVQALPRPYKLTPAVLKQRLKQLAHELEEAAGIRLGASANKFLFGYLPGVVPAKQGQNAYYDHELYQDLMAAFQHRHLLFGASANTRMDPSLGYQFANDECLESGLALALYETDLRVGAALSHGFTHERQLRVSVDELADADEDGAGYEVTILDGKPATTRLQELKEAGYITLDRPVFGLPNGEDHDIYWPLTLLDAGPNLRLKRKVRRGDRLFLLEAKPERLLAIGPETMQQTIEQSSVRPCDIGLFLCFSCGGWIRQHQAPHVPWGETVKQIAQQYTPTPIVGVVSAGEFGLDALYQTRSANMSFSVIAPTKTFLWRARGRDLQRNLVQEASKLLLCKWPKDVMKSALKGAVAAGANGGKISIVDHHLKRILCQSAGYALPAKKPAPNWLAVGELTNFPLAVRHDKDFPLELRANAMAVVPNLDFQLNYVELQRFASSAKPEDILQLAVRTLHAIFIPNCEEYEQYGLINSRGRKIGNIISQLVIPLVGTDYKVIAVLQLSFPEHKPGQENVLDRESLALWIGYAQRVAAALERADETAQREIVGRITALGNRLMHKPLGSNLDPHEWCQEFVESVVAWLGADGGHLRALRIGPKDEDNGNYWLRAATGLLADVLKKTRSRLSEHDGSFRRTQFHSDGVFKDTREAVRQFNASVGALDKVAEHGHELAKQLGEINSTALLPLGDHTRKRILGSLAIDSSQEYFFTTRKRQIVQAAAEQASAILQAKRSEYFRAHLQRGIDSLRDVRAGYLKGLHPGHTPTAGELLQSTIKRICHIVGADVASVFAWYEKPQKLLLYSCHNWYHPLVGQASYKAGEGWTGSLALQEQEVSILPPGHNSGQRRYYTHMIPPQQDYNDQEARIGIQLKDGDRLVGVMTLLYYKSNSETLNNQIATIEPFLRAVQTVVALGMEAALRETRELRTNRYFAAKDQIFKLLIERQWEAALEVMREHLLVERALTYRWHNGQLELDKSVQTLPMKEGQPMVSPPPILQEVFNKKELLLISAPDDVALRQWPAEEKVRNLLALPLSPLDEVPKGVVVFINQREDISHPFEIFDELEQKVAAEFARPLAVALEVEGKDQALADLRSQLVTATKIGAQGLASGILMHQLLSPFAQIRRAIDWLSQNPNKPPDERAERLKRIEIFYEQALETIQRAGHGGTPGLARRERLSRLVGEAIKFVEPLVTDSHVKIEIDNKVHAEVIIDLWSAVGALINLLTNALEEMEDAGVLSISTWLSDDEVTASIRIHNTCAVPPTEADIARFLQPGHTDKGGDSHMGYGLPLAQRAIETAKGKLTLQPTTEGFEAVITLPVAKSRESQIAHAEGVS